MRNRILLAISIGALALPLAACNEQDAVSAEQTFGPSPTLPAPQHSWTPTVNFANATGWPAGGKPTAADGMTVAAFAAGLDHPRTLYVLPDGDVLVAETNAPPNIDDVGGIKGWTRKWVLGRVAETRTVFIEGLNSPFGMTLVGDDFYVADSDAILKFPYHNGDTRSPRSASS